MPPHPTEPTPASSAQAAELLLQASQEILLLLDASSLRIRAANVGAYQALGYPEGQLLNLPIGDLECALSDMFFWDEMPNHVQVHDVESSLRCANGQVLPILKSVRTVQPADGGTLYVLRAVASAEQSRIEQDLSALGSRLRATLEATSEGILLVDQSDAIVNMNQQLAVIWQLSDDLLSRHDDAAVFSHMQGLCAQGEPVAGEASKALIDGKGGVGHETAFLHDGRVIECAVKTATSGQEVIGRVYSYRDVSERHRQQEELIAARDEAKRASRAKGEFLAMMSHEIRTPMNGVLGVAELLSHTALDATQTEYVRIIRSSGETLLTILNDILDYSKIEAGRLQIEQTPFELRTLLNEVDALFRHRTQTQGLVFSCQAAPNLPTHVQGDPVRLRQILFNLIGNAFKFTSQGRIDVVVALDTSHPATPPDLQLRFSVRDTGIGLSEEQMSRLFRSFEQADNSITRKYGGTGLGLAICKRLAEMMGGHIGVHSTLGQGSEFWFTCRLQTMTAPLPSPTPQPPTAIAPEALASARILLVEDHPVNRTLVSSMLKRLGAQHIDIAENGQEAVEKASAKTYDVVLMDSQMPVMDGLEATRTLRQQGFSRPIIGLSAGATDEERQASLSAGANDYVLKPVQMAVLGQALARALASV